MSGEGNEKGRSSPTPSSTSSLRTAGSAIMEGLSAEASNDVYELIMNRKIRRSHREVKTSARSLYQCTQNDALVLLVRMANEALDEIDDQQFGTGKQSGQVTDAGLENLREIQELQNQLQQTSLRVIQCSKEVQSLQAQLEETKKQEDDARRRLAIEQENANGWRKQCEISHQENEQLQASLASCKSELDLLQRPVLDDGDEWRGQCEIFAQENEQLRTMLATCESELELLRQPVNGYPREHADAFANFAMQSITELTQVREIAEELQKELVREKSAKVVDLKVLEALEEKHRQELEILQRDFEKKLNQMGTTKGEGDTSTNAEGLIAQLKADLMVKQTEVDVFKQKYTEAMHRVHEIERAGQDIRPDPSAQPWRGEGTRGDNDDARSTASSQDSNEFKARMSVSQIMRRMSAASFSSLNPADQLRSQRNYAALSPLEEGELESDGQLLTLIELKDAELETLLQQVRKVADVKTGKNYKFLTEEHLLKHVEDILRHSVPVRDVIIGGMNAVSIEEAIRNLKARYALVKDDISGSAAATKLSFDARLSKMKFHDQQILMTAAETAFSKVSPAFAERCKRRPRDAMGSTVLSELRGHPEAGWFHLISASEVIVQTRWEHMLGAFKDLISYMDYMEEACHGSVLLIEQCWDAELERFERNYGKVDMRMLKYFGKLTVLNSPKTAFIKEDKEYFIQERTYDDGFSDYKSAAEQVDKIWLLMGERERTAYDPKRRNAAQLQPKKWKTLMKNNTGNDEKHPKGEKIDYVKLAREAGQQEAYSALFMPDIPQSKSKACGSCGSYHAPGADCGPTLETKLKQKDEIDKLANNVTRMAQIFAKDKVKRTADDERQVKEFGTRLREVAERLKAPPARTHDAKRGGFNRTPHAKNESKGQGDANRKADCIHWKKYGTCKFGDACMFKHDINKKGCDESGGGGAKEKAPRCPLEDCDKECPWDETKQRYWKHCSMQHAMKAKGGHVACPAVLITVDDPEMQPAAVLAQSRSYVTAVVHEKQPDHELVREIVQDLFDEDELAQVNWTDPEDQADVGKVILIAAIEGVLGHKLHFLDQQSVCLHWEPGMLSEVAVLAMFDNESASDIAMLYNAAYAQVRDYSLRIQADAQSQMEINRVLVHDEMEGIVLQALSMAIKEVDDRERPPKTPGPNQLAWEELKAKRMQKQAAASAHQERMRQQAQARAQKLRVKAEKRAVKEAAEARQRQRLKIEDFALGLVYDILEEVEYVVDSAHEEAQDTEAFALGLVCDLVDRAHTTTLVLDIVWDVVEEALVPIEAKPWRHVTKRVMMQKRAEEREQAQWKFAGNFVSRFLAARRAFKAFQSAARMEGKTRKMKRRLQLLTCEHPARYRADGGLQRRMRRHLHTFKVSRMQRSARKHLTRTYFPTDGWDSMWGDDPPLAHDQSEIPTEDAFWRDLVPADVSRPYKRRRFACESDEPGECPEHDELTHFGSSREDAQWERTGGRGDELVRNHQRKSEGRVIAPNAFPEIEISEAVLNVENAFAPDIYSTFMSLGSVISRHLHFDADTQQYVCMPASDAIDFFASYNAQVSEIMPGLILILFDTGCTVFISPMTDHFCVEVTCNAAINGIGKRNVTICGPVAISFLDAKAKSYVTFESPRGFLMADLNFGIFPSGLAEKKGWEFHIRELNPYFVADGVTVPLIKDYQTGLTWMAERKYAKPTVLAKRRFAKSTLDGAKVFQERIGDPEICPKLPDTKENIDRYLASQGSPSFGQYHISSSTQDASRGGRARVNALIGTRSQSKNKKETQHDKQEAEAEVTESEIEVAETSPPAVENSEELEVSDGDKQMVTEKGLRDLEIPLAKSKTDDELITKAKVVAASKMKPRHVKVPAARFFENGDSEQVASWRRLWHQMAVHLDSSTVWEGVKHAEGAEVLKGLELLERATGDHKPECPCHECLKYKSTLSPIPAGRTQRPRRTERVEKMYLDPSGKLSTPSIYHNFQYYVLGVTDVGYMLVRGMTFRDQALFVIGRMFDSVGGAPKIVQVDPAGELNSKIAESYFTHREALVDKTQASEHWRNGRAETRHKLIKACSRCTLAHANAPLEFWFLCLSHVVFTLNLLLLSRESESRKVKEMTIWEAHFGEKPNLNRYLIGPWGCLAYIVLTKEQRDKRGMDKSWGPRALAGIYVGCVLNHKEGAYEFLVHDGMRLRSTTANLRIVGDCYPFKYQQKRDIDLVVEPSDEDLEDEDRELIANVAAESGSQASLSAFSCEGVDDLMNEAAREHEKEVRKVFVFVGKEDANAGENLKKRIVRSSGKGRALLKSKRKVQECIARNSAPGERSPSDYLLEVLETGERTELLDPRDFKLTPAPNEFNFELPYDGARYKVAKPEDFATTKEMTVTMKNPHERFVGRQVRKVFRIRRKVRGKAMTVAEPFEGKVRSYDVKREVFDILYEDKDEEEVDFLELSDILIMDPKFGDKAEHKGKTRREVNEKLGEEALIAAVAEEAMASHGRTSYGEDRPGRKSVSFADEVRNFTTSGGSQWRKSMKKKIDDEQEFVKWMYDESDSKECSCTPESVRKKDEDVVYNASRCECEACEYCYTCQDDEVKWCEEKMQILMYGSDAEFLEGEMFKYTKKQLERQLRQGKLEKLKAATLQAHVAEEEGQGIEDSVSPSVDADADVKIDDAPKNAKELHAHEEYEEIIKSGKLEIKQLFDMGVFTLPSEEELKKIKDESKRVLRCKMVYARKYQSVMGKDGKIRDEFLKWKGRLAAVGTGEVKSLDTCWSTFSPTIGMTAMRTLIALMCRKGFDVRSYDLSGAFLGTDLGREVYVKLPEEAGKYAGNIVRCEKALYGLITSSRDFVNSLSKRILSFEDNGGKFKKLDTDHCIYVFSDKDGNEMILSHYVDDIICGSNNEELRQRLFKHLNQQWKITDEGVLTRFVGLNFERSEDGMTWEASCGPYIDKVAKRFKVDRKIQTTPMDAGFAVMPEDLREEHSAEEMARMETEFRSMIGSLAFASVTVRWDIAYSVSVLSRYLMKPNRKVIGAARRVIQYLVTTRDFKLRWTSEEDKVPADLKNKLWGAADASYASDVITRRSHGGYMLFLNGGCVSWKSGLQKMVTLSSCESEFVALCSAILEVRYLRQFLNELGHRQEVPTLLWEDNKAAIIVAEGETSSAGRSKHIDIRFKHVAQSIREGVARVRYISTKWNYADLMTKPLGRIEFERLRDMCLRPESGMAGHADMAEENTAVEEEVANFFFDEWWL